LCRLKDAAAAPLRAEFDKFRLNPEDYISSKLDDPELRSVLAGEVCSVDVNAVNILVKKQAKQFFALVLRGQSGPVGAAVPLLSSLVLDRLHLFLNCAKIQFSLVLRVLPLSSLSALHRHLATRRLARTTAPFRKLWRRVAADATPTTATPTSTLAAAAAGATTSTTTTTTATGTATPPPPPRHHTTTTTTTTISPNNTAAAPTHTAGTPGTPSASPPAPVCAAAGAVLSTSSSAVSATIDSADRLMEAMHAGHRPEDGELLALADRLRKQKQTLKKNEKKGMKATKLTAVGREWRCFLPEVHPFLLQYAPLTEEHKLGKMLQNFMQLICFVDDEAADSPLSCDAAVLLEKGRALANTWWSSMWALRSTAIVQEQVGKTVVPHLLHAHAPRFVVLFRVLHHERYQRATMQSAERENGVARREWTSHCFAAAANSSAAVLTRLLEPSLLRSPSGPK